MMLILYFVRYKSFQLKPTLDVRLCEPSSSVLLLWPYKTNLCIRIETILLTKLDQDSVSPISLVFT